MARPADNPASRYREHTFLLCELRTCRAARTITEPYVGSMQDALSEEMQESGRLYFRTNDYGFWRTTSAPKVHHGHP